MTPQLLVIPGPGAVIRRNDAVVVVTGTVTRELVTELQALLESDDAAGNARRIMSRLLMGTDLDGAAVLVLRELEVDLFALGDVEVTTTAGTVSADGHPLGVAGRYTIDDLVTVAGSAAETGAGWQTLEAGAVAGSGVEFERAEVTGEDVPASTNEPEGDQATADEHGAATSINPAISVDVVSEVSPPSPPEAPDPAVDYVVVSLQDDTDSSPRPPAPTGFEEETLPPYAQPVTVLGVMSPTGHFNHPDARYCSRSGVKMGASHTKVLVEGDRPPLGVITFDDGATYSVQYDTVVGREPESDSAVQAGTAAPLSLSDDHREVSRRHLRIELIDWDGYITDLETANGTFVRDAADQEARRLGRGERATLNSGAEVFLGSTRFVYHEHHVR